MASETFNHYYSITSGVPGGTITLGAVNNPVGGTDLVETTADSDGINGQTEVGNAILAFGSQRTLAGFTASGDPIVLMTTGPDIYYVFSNDGGLSGSISSSNTGTYLYCFASGTGIATPEGEQAVETLCPGDLILTAQGQTTPVKWIGRQTVSAPPSA